MTVPMLEGKLAERACLVPRVTELLSPRLGPSLKGSPLHWWKRQAALALGRLMLLGPRESRLVYAFSVFCVQRVRHCARGVRLDPGSKELLAMWMITIQYKEHHRGGAKEKDD